MTLFLLVKPPHFSFSSIHVQIRFPPVIHRPDKITNKHHMIWLDRLAKERHLGLMGSLISLLVVAPDARAHQVLPYVHASAGTWNNVVNGEGHIGAATVLASVTIPPQDVLSGKDDFLEGNSDIDGKANNAREWHRSRHRMKELAVNRGYELCFSQIQKNDRLFYVTNAERLVVVV
jgi:hypothetical protein